MFYMKAHTYRLVGTVLVMAVIVGCASLATVATPSLEPKKDTLESTEHGWWHTRFVIKWPEEKEPSWHVDLLLAREIVSPVLHQHKKDIVLWRFHRRAVRDAIRHQFSFIFYSSPETAREVYSGMQSHPLLAALKRAGIVMKDSYDDTTQMSQPRIEDTSDLDWSSPIKKSWPYYMMGVSQMWLHLIGEITEDLSKETASLSVQDLEAFYQEVNASLEATWGEEGGHAFLHHLNALFEYKPVIIYERRLMTF